jgi:hypothetical protein
VWKEGKRVSFCLQMGTERSDAPWTLHLPPDSQSGYIETSPSTSQGEMQRGPTASWSTVQTGFTYHTPRRNEVPSEATRKLSPSRLPRHTSSPPYTPRATSFRPRSRDSRCYKAWDTSGCHKRYEEQWQQDPCMKNTTAAQVENLLWQCPRSPQPLCGHGPCSSQQCWRSSCVLSCGCVQHQYCSDMIWGHQVKRVQSSEAAICTSPPGEMITGRVTGSCYTAPSCSETTALSCSWFPAQSNLCERAAQTQLHSQLQCSRFHRNMETVRALLEEPPIPF